MTYPLLDRLTQTMTYWAPSGSSFSAGVLFAPGNAQGGVRWSAGRVSKFHSEAGRSSTPTDSVVLLTPVQLGGCVALGNHVASLPGAVPTVHEVIEYRETPSLDGSFTVRKAIVKPLIGLLRQSVTIYPMTRVVAGRSHTVERGSAVYTGVASVDMPTAGAQGSYAGAPTIDSGPITVTVPHTANLGSASQFEVHWNGLVFDSQGPLFNNLNSPFWQSLSCVYRRPRF